MFSAALLFAAIAFSPADAKVAYDATSALVEKHPVRVSGTLSGRLAANWIFDRVSRCGVDPEFETFTDESPDGPLQFTNVRVEFPAKNGNTDNWIVILSHFDTPKDAPEGFQGANDGASTTGIMIALAGSIRRAMKESGLNAPVELIFTDGEEHRIAYTEKDGFHGSRHAAKRYKESGRKVRAVICLDMLGDKDLHISIPRNGNAALKRMAMLAAERCGMKDEVSLMGGSQIVLDDHVAFLDAGFKAIDLIDFEFGSAPGKNDYWHTAADRMDKVSEKSMEKSGRLTAALINLLQLKP